MERRLVEVEVGPEVAARNGSRFIKKLSNILPIDIIDYGAASKLLSA